LSQDFRKTIVQWKPLKAKITASEKQTSLSVNITKINFASPASIRSSYGKYLHAHFWPCCKSTTGPKICNENR